MPGPFWRAAALAAVRRWAFCSAYEDGVPVETDVRIRIPFQLETN